MKIKEIDLIPLKGIGPLLFGATTKEALDIIGKPNSTEVIRDTDEMISTVVWHFDKDKLTLYFEGEEKEVLACCETDNPDTLIFGQKIFKMDHYEIIELMKSQSYNDIEEDDETWGERRISFEDALTDFYFVDGRLTNVSLGVFINSKGDVEWPVISQTE